MEGGEKRLRDDDQDEGAEAELPASKAARSLEEAEEKGEVGEGDQAAGMQGVKAGEEEEEERLLLGAKKVIVFALRALGPDGFLRIVAV